MKVVIHELQSKLCKGGIHRALYTALYLGLGVLAGIIKGCGKGVIKGDTGRLD